MWPNPEFPADLVTCTKEILNGTLHFFVQCEGPMKYHLYVCLLKSIFSFVRVCIRIFWFFAQCMVSSNSKSDGAQYFVEKSWSGVFWPNRSQKAPKMKFFKFHEELRLRVRINKKECIAVLQRERSELEPAAGTKIFAIRFLQHKICFRLIYW